MAAPQAQFDLQCLEAIKMLGKTLGQMSLYKVGHPAVAAIIAQAEDLLSKALAETPQGELSFSIDEDKLISNGRIVASVLQLPNTVPAFFSRFKLNSLTFKSGLTNQELVAFCELAASRPDAATTADPQAYLAGKGVAHIIFSEAVYSKMGDEALLAVLEQKSIEETVKALVGNAVSDPHQHKKVYDKVMNLLKDDIERRVEEVSQPLRHAKGILENEQVRTQGVMQSMGEGVVVVDDQGKILMRNPAAEEIYGATLAQAAGLSLTEKAGEQHLISLAAEISTPADRAIKKDIAVKGSEDTTRTIKASSAVVQNEAGKIVGMVSTLTDMAKQRELQKMEREFVAHVTHELRSPLSSIKAALDIIQDEFQGKMPEEGQRMLKTAVNNSERLEALITGILDFSKIESGQMTVFPKRADPEKMASEALESLMPWATKRKIGLSLEVEPALPTIMADYPRTIQVLVNLLSNAIKFTPAGGMVTLRVAKSAEGREKKVEFSVNDTGPGIPKSEQGRIFEKFIQIASGEMHVGGTGLGLAIAKALVHMQGGRLWVESDVGKGSTFLFTLPISEAPVKEAPVPVAAPRPWWKELLGLD